MLSRGWKMQLAKFADIPAIELTQGETYIFYISQLVGM